ncbi:MULTISPECIES: restriction endonuclease subunit S [Aeromonas]|uniref:restriction endonuclease subunit S n=1 Tax=Aeromonas TaxID=642 RepID=UPI001315D0A9|nr:MULTISPECIES: restriction endonuclease subunit S [Aeromonas]EKP0311802.1 restriction endonuclease subunit S [Aeromonas veronii]MBE8736769.1 restriction endonuclease subunit S [Aeromonas veronii]MBE8740792.1 restriction endonuclease subunit S [Aeromonas veronii]MBE8745413.1 restriction endonuclease subunit S [Aeromonas veronii]MBE8765171.1 restriction endonuclease subunit S [Aeromonas veronii]
MAIESLITDHLALWTAAVRPKSSAGRGSNSKLELTGIKKLRELILELAVRGKLVPQDPSDEPASMLLERIACEKARLVKEKKIKKPKALPEIDGEDKPFELPEGWEWACIGYVGNIFNGNSVNAKVKEEKYTCITEGYPFIATKDVGYGFDKLDYENGVTIPFDEANFKVAHKNAVLICAEGGSAGKKCGITDKDICFGNKLFAIELFSNFEPKLLLATYLTPTFFSNFSAAMTGIIGGISVNKFSELLIPIPPLAEQHRIVAKVDELMALCDQLELRSESQLAAHQTLVETLLTTLTDSADADELSQNWARLSSYFDTLFTTESSIDALKQTILQLAVTGTLVSWGNNVREEKLKNCISFGPRNGFSPKETTEDTGVYVLKLGATSYGSLNLTEIKNIDVAIEKESHLFIRKDDILIQRGNSANYVGSSCLVEGDVDGIIYPDLMMKIMVNHKVSAKYLSLWLSSPRSRRFMWDRMTGTSGTMPKISKKVVEEIPVMVPVMACQNDIVAKVDELMTLCEQLKASLQINQQTQLALAESLVEGALEDSI